MEAGGSPQERRADDRRKKKVTPKPEPEAVAPPPSPPISEEPAVPAGDPLTAPWIPEAFRSGPVSDELTALQESWPELVARCELLQPALRTLLRDSWPVTITDVELTIGFDPEFATEVEEVRLLDHGALHRMFSEVLGRSILIGYTRLDRPVSWSHQRQDAQVPAAEQEDSEFDPERAGHDVRQWQKHPKIRQVLEVFNGDILDVQPRLNP